jgi:D-tyrosyl-tRNA(Tyr) deacylase
MMRASFRETHGTGVIALIQRVSEASVTTGDLELGRIGPGLVALVGVTRDDTEAQAERLAERMLGYRVFPDADGRMNLSLSDVARELILVPNFTLAADTAKGTRASFTPAAPPERATALFDHLVRAARARHGEVAAGRFGADMRVTLVNDGPVTFLLSA